MVPNLGYFLTATLTLPVWDWGTLRSKLHQAEYKQQEAKSLLSQEQRLAVSELYAAYNEAAMARNAVEESRKTAELATESLRLVNLRYEGGASPATEVVDAENTLLTARNAYIDAQARYRAARGGFTDHYRKLLKHDKTQQQVHTSEPSDAFFFERTATERAGNPGPLMYSQSPAWPSRACSYGAARSPAEEEVTPTVTVQVDAAQKGAIQLKVNADAVLYPKDQAAIVPKVVSPVKKFYVERGTHVKAGQLLAELENQDLAGAHQKSQGGYQQAEATYQMEVQKAQQDLGFSKQSLDAAQKLYDSRQAMFKEGAVSAKDVEDARLSQIQAQNAVRPGAEAVRPQGGRSATERGQGRYGERRSAIELHENHQPDRRRGDRPAFLPR